MKISVSFYTITFYPKRRPDSPQRIDDLAGNQGDFFEYLKPYLDEYDEYVSGEVLSPESETARNVYHDKTHFTVNNRERIISGQLKSADSGQASDVHAPTGSYKARIERDDLIFTPFYYSFNIEAGKKYAILALQSFGNKGVKSDFVSRLKSDLAQIYRDYTINFSPVHLGPIFFDEIIDEGKLKKLEAVYFADSSDPADIGGEKVKVVHTISPTRRGTFLPERLSNIIRRFKEECLNRNMSRDQRSEIIHQIKHAMTLNLGDNEVEDISAYIQVGETVKKINLGNIEKFATRYDLTDDVEINRDGYPLFQSIDDEVKQITERQIRQLINE